jgi:hypothetical protein
LERSDVVFVASVAALPLVLGVQVALGNTKAFRFGWLFFLFCAVYCTASGFGSLIFAALGEGLLPRSLLFLVLGTAMLAGLGILRVVFARKFANGI